MLGREVEDDAMVPLAQKRFAGCFEGKYSGLAFDPPTTMLLRDQGPRRSPLPINIMTQTVGRPFDPRLAGGAIQSDAALRQFERGSANGGVIGNS